MKIKNYYLFILFVLTFLSSACDVTVMDRNRDLFSSSSSRSSPCTGSYRIRGMGSYSGGTVDVGDSGFCRFELFFNSYRDDITCNYTSFRDSSNPALRFRIHGWDSRYRREVNIDIEGRFSWDCNEFRSFDGMVYFSKP